MKKITPYKTFNGALRALDNGGRFYNIFTDAEDERIDSAELVKAAGVFTSLSKAFLYYTMPTFNLAEKAQSRLRAHLNPLLRTDYRQKAPQAMVPSRIETRGKTGAPAIVTGFARHLEKLTFDDPTPKKHGLFLETIYYTPLEDSLLKV